MAVGSLQPTWFDADYGPAFEQATAEEVMKEVAQCPRIRQAVKNALAKHDEDKRKNPKWKGPTRSQVVRTTIVTELQAIS